MPRASQVQERPAAGPAPSWRELSACWNVSDSCREGRSPVPPRGRAPRPAWSRWSLAVGLGRPTAKAVDENETTRTKTITIAAKTPKRSAGRMSFRLKNFY